MYCLLSPFPYLFPTFSLAIEHCLPLFLRHSNIPNLHSAEMPACHSSLDQQCHWQFCCQPEQPKYILHKMAAKNCLGQQSHICYLRRNKSTPVIRKPSPEVREREGTDPWADFPKTKVDDESAIRCMNRIPKRELSDPLDYVRYKSRYGARFIHEGVRTGDGRMCVLKHLRSERHAKSEEIILTMGMAKRAAYIVASFKRAVKAMDDERYRRRSHSRRRRSYYDSLEGWDIEVNVPVPFYGDRHYEEGYLIEPFVDGYRDFNSTDGWARDSPKLYNKIMQALSHYSYGFSGGEYLLCNLKAGVDWDRRILTICNPAFMSRGDGEVFGPLDIGSRGIDLFFRRYECGKLGEEWPKYPDRRA